ncbi:SDR family NAD(P)-dependent oxidoreductase [Frondihabitans cladoniiphilus]|uniref:SDR family NAD(P)-dependent oxidoreductase n=1 Tax=Frondihabitans cladoniiphilus TaxID=715785 RepID=A0ABP8VSB9_9MICO
MPTEETTAPSTTPRRIALVTGANQGVGRQVALELAAAGVTVFVGSRDLARGKAAAAEIGQGATALQIDVTDTASIARAAATIDATYGRLDLLVSNAGISNVGGADRTPEENAASSKASTASLDEIRAVWDVNVFGVVAVYQAMLPLLRKGVDARIVTVSSGVGSLTANADPTYPYHSMFGPVYPASKAAENAMALAMMVELEDTDIKINLVSPGYTSTALNNFNGTDTIEEGSREVVRVALLGPDGPTGTFTRWEDTTIPW